MSFTSSEDPRCERPGARDSSLPTKPAKPKVLDSEALCHCSTFVASPATQPAKGKPIVHVVDGLLACQLGLSRETQKIFG